MQRAEILDALRDVGAELVAAGGQGDVYLVGGAAMALGYDRERATRDVDGLFAPKQEVYAAARRVAERRGLQTDWLNDAVKGFLLGPDRGSTQVIELPGLRVEVASAETVLVMKAIAHRAGEDDADLRLLAARLGLDAGGVLDLVERTAGPRWLTVQVQLFVESVLDSRADEPPPHPSGA